jgi:hypothetical protein
METLSISTTPTIRLESVVSLNCGVRPPSTSRCFATHAFGVQQPMTEAQKQLASMISRVLPRSALKLETRKAVTQSVIP